MAGSRSPDLDEFLCDLNNAVFIKCGGNPSTCYRCGHRDLIGTREKPLYHIMPSSDGTTDPLDFDKNGEPLDGCTICHECAKELGIAFQFRQEEC